jgi:polyketide cyclase/dehydrase/lipid transport protein
MYIPPACRSTGREHRGIVRTHRLEEKHHMQRLTTLVALGALAAAGAAGAAEPEYKTIEMEIDVAKPAKDVWAKVGGYCDISVWLNVECKITSGNGGMGTVRVLAGGRVTEILVAQTDLSYGYTQPAREGQFYNLYHGFMEVKPVTDRSSKILYTLVYDVSDKPDQAAKDADVAQRRTRFEQALKNMKDLVEK